MAKWRGPAAILAKRLRRVAMLRGLTPANDLLRLAGAVPDAPRLPAASWHRSTQHPRLRPAV